MLWITIAVVIFLFLYFALRRVPLRVQESLEIAAAPEQLFAYVRDLRNWKAFSPWLLHEPDCALHYSEDPSIEGGHYEWDGTYIGEGSLTHVKLDAPYFIEQNVAFLSPFKNVGVVCWRFVPGAAGQTTVSWEMETSMPYVIRLLVPTIKNSIAADYQLGLRLLKGIFEPDYIAPKLVFSEPVERAPTPCLTVPFAGTESEMAAKISAGMTQLMQSGVKAVAPPLVAYHKVDALKKYFVGDVCLPVHADTQSEKFEKKMIAGGKYFKTTSIGPYVHLPVAWSSALQHVRIMNHKLDWKQRPSLEQYDNNPQEVTEDKIITTLLIPVQKRKQAK